MHLWGKIFDDCLIIVDNQADKQWSVDESDKFDCFTGQRVGHKKTVAFSSPPVKDDELISTDVKLKSVKVHGNNDT